MCCVVSLTDDKNGPLVHAILTRVRNGGVKFIMSKNLFVLVSKSKTNIKNLQLYCHASDFAPVAATKLLRATLQSKELVL